MEAVHGADFDAVGVFALDTAFEHKKSHGWVILSDLGIRHAYRESVKFIA
jgi:hypothetical protein